jgi:hypothetical protein
VQAGLDATLRYRLGLEATANFEVAGPVLAAGRALVEAAR